MDVFDGGPTPPSLALLQQYQSVIVANDLPFGDATGVGTVLADYADTGGGVVLTLASFINGCSKFSTTA